MFSDQCNFCKAFWETERVLKNRVYMLFLEFFSAPQDLQLLENNNLKGDVAWYTNSFYIAGLAINQYIHVSPWLMDSGNLKHWDALSLSPVPEFLFLPAPYGAKPGRAKRESRITCMRMLRTPLFFPPNRGKNHIWQYFPEAACGAIFWIIIYKQQFLHSDWVKNISINPKSVEYYQCHAKPHSICFFTTISKITKEIFVRTLLLDGSARS